MNQKITKKLIASDYDGTVRIDGKIAPAVVEAVKAWRAAGHYFGIVTGRGRDFLDTIHNDEIAEAGLELDFVVMYNGSLITDVNGNEWFSREIDKDSFIALEKIFASIPDTVDYSHYSEGDRLLQYYARYETPARALEVSDYINQTMGNRVASFVNYWHVNVAAHGVSKATGVSRVLDHYGLSEEETAVVGDDWNDLSMLTAHDGYVMESGTPAVREKIGQCCTSVDALIKSFM